MQLEVLMPKAGRKAYIIYPNGKADDDSFLFFRIIQRLPWFAKLLENRKSKKDEQSL
jgi:hypothetical protein